jgi:uncharacterized protein (DUF3820 family)
MVLYLVTNQGFPTGIFGRLTQLCNASTDFETEATK